MLRTFFVFVIALTFALPKADAADLLTIGSDAPPLDVEHWVQNGNGKFSPVTKFKAGNVYVVEFWATWCGPCVMSMPHLAQLQQDYADKGVQLVSISDEDLETVTKFLGKKVRGEDEKTYKELTSVYCLTTDPDGSTQKDYMEAALQGGIPTAFIVGKDGKVEWIGHPMEMDQPLEQIVDGSWDREVFAAEFVPQQKLQKLQMDVQLLMQEGESEKALKLLDEAIANDKDSIQLKMFKLQLFLMTGNSADANKVLSGVFSDVKADPQQTDSIAWGIYQMASQAGMGESELVTTALTAIKAASQKAEGSVKASTLDTLAHFLAMRNDVAAAIAAEEEAVKLAGADNKQFIEAYLKELKSLQEKAKEKEGK